MARICLCILILALVLCAGARGAEISLDRLSVLTNGLPMSDVEAVLGTNWQHQFTARTGTNVYLCVSYHFQYPFIYYYFLFRDTQLSKICLPPTFDTEVVERNGMRVEVRKPLDPELRVSTVINAEGITTQELRSGIHERLQKKIAGENAGILPAIILTSPLLVPSKLIERPEVKREYQRNQELAEHFDPMKMKPGKLLKEARDVYGREVLSKQLSAEKSVFCWGGDERLPKVKPEHRYSPVCALVESNQIQQIYSHDFVQGMR